MPRPAVALRAFTHADASFAKGDLVAGLSDDQFADWSAPGVDLVRAADEPAQAEPAPADAEPGLVLDPPTADADHG